MTYIRTHADQARSAGASRAVVDELIVLTLLYAGLKARELCALRIADTPATHGKPELHVQSDHGTRSRMVPVPQDMVHRFQRFVRLYRAGARPTDPLLWSERQTPFSYISLYSKLRRIGRQVGLARLSPAVLRHSFLVRLYEKERDLRLVQEQAGHARLRSTARHVRPRKSARRCAGCDTILAPTTGRTIDSGQLLCPVCLKDLRSH